VGARYRQRRNATQSVDTVIDTHCHLDAYPDPLQACRDADQRCSMTVAVTNSPTAFERAYPHIRSFRHIRIAVGLHPLVKHSEADLVRFERLLQRTSFVGEVGMDFSPAGAATRAAQERVFQRVSQLVAQRPSFVTVHSRRAESAVLDILEDAKAGPVVFHWFTGSPRLLDRVIAAGHWCSVNPAMVENAAGRMIVGALPPSRVLTESDGPHGRVGGRSATSADVTVVTRYLAKLWNTTEREVLSQIAGNFRDATAGIRAIFGREP
jgi:TatD DNase family protein